MEQRIDKLTASLFCRNRYIGVYLNRNGMPTEIINQEVHLYRTFCDRLINNNIKSFYHIPDVSDLNDLFSEKFPTKTNYMDIGYIDPFFVKQLRQSENEKPAIVWQSKNIIEQYEISDVYACAYPITSVILLKLNADQFFGIVTFNDSFYQFRALGYSPVIVLDKDKNIVAYTAKLALMLNIKKSDELLNCNIQSISNSKTDDMFLEKHPFPVENIQWKEIVSWKKCQDIDDLFYKFANENSVDCFCESEKLIWSNNTKKEYAYLKLKNDLSFDNQELKIEIVFSSVDQTMPNIIIRGRNNFPATYEDFPPDDFGFNLSRHYHFGKWNYMLKFATEHFLVLPSRKYIEGERIRISIEKHDNIIIIRENDIILGEKLFLSPNDTQNNNGCFLFLRPEQKIELFNFKVYTSKSHKSYQKKPPEPFLTIDYNNLHFDLKCSVISTVWDMNNVFLLVLADVTDLKTGLTFLENERKTLTKLLKSTDDFFSRSPKVEKIIKNLPIVSESNLSVMIQGETGTGKEVLARTIHNLSQRKNNPFVKLDCSSVPEGLMESELFGHEKGAFTGALTSHIGRFEQAQGGTLFLDEISNITRAIQAKLLGVLQDYKIQRLGGVETIPLDIRIIAASNLPIGPLVDKGLFREDLYYRINQYLFELPPLRERPEDIPILSDIFLDEVAALYGRKKLRLSSDAVDLLIRMPWRGNIRELKSLIHKAALFCRDDELHPDHFISDSIDIQTKPFRQTAYAKRKPRNSLDITQETIIEKLRHYNGNLNAIARDLSLSRPSLYKILDRYSINISRFRT